MLIGDLAKKTGFSRDTIRYYEKIGLINLDRKQRRENDYKEYPEYLVDRLLFTQRLKQYGFTLSEIREMLELYDDEILECDDVFEWVDQKLNQVAQKIEELRSIHQKLSSLQTEARRCKDNQCQLPVWIVLKNWFLNSSALFTKIEIAVTRRDFNECRNSRCALLEL